MGLFTKKKKDDGYTNVMPKLPTLPKLPGHSQFPEIPLQKQTPGELLNLKNQTEEIHQLPSFPSNSLGEKISQDTIKNAIGTPTNEENYDYNEINDDEDMPKIIPEKVKSPTFDSLPYLNTTKNKSEIKDEIIPRVKSTDPIFIRIDKFEESLKIFQTVKRKISEIEELLKDTKNIKKKEEEELTAWEDEILQLKMQIEKVDEDIFSKIN